jgi:hypothetical protein
MLSHKVPGGLSEITPGKQVFRGLLSTKTKGAKGITVTISF